MRKFNIIFVLSCIVCILGSCAYGTYVPPINSIGAQTTVVLDRANFRVVRNVEVFVEVDNNNLNLMDVKHSAYAELMRKYPLTGSQTYINVVFEEVHHEKVFGFFFVHAGRYALKQYVAVRATIIEFLQENGQPIQSVEYPEDTLSQDTKLTDGEIVQTLPSFTPEEMEVMREKAKMRHNQFYMVLLLKTGTFNKDIQDVAEQLFDLKEIKKLCSEYALKEIVRYSEGHDKVYEKFAE